MFQIKRFITRRFVLAAVLAGFAPLCLAAPAAAAAGDLAGAREVVAAVPRESPPQTHLDGNRRPAGFAIDLMGRIARRAGLTVRYRIVDGWAEAVEALRGGRADVVPGLAITEDRAREFAFTSPVGVSTIALLVRAETRAVAGLHDLAGGRVAAVEISAAVELLDGRDGVEVVTYRDISPALFALLAGQVDGVAYFEEAAFALAREAGVADRLRVAGPPLAEIKRGLAIPKDDEALLARLERAVTATVGTPEYRDIYLKWHDTPEPFWTPARLAWILGGLLALGVGAAMVRRHAPVFAVNRRLKGTPAERDTAQLEIESLGKFPAENPSPLLRVKPGGTVTYANQAAQALMPAAEPTVNPEYPARWDAFLREAASAHSRKEIGLECAGRFFSFLAAPVAEAGYVSLFGRDVTESKRTEALLRLQGTAMDTVANAIFIMDREGRILWINEAFTRLTGYTPEEALGNTPQILESGTQNTTPFEDLLDGVLRGEVWRGDTVGRHKDGRLYTVCQTVTPMRDDSGDVSYLIAVQEDITARKEAEEHALRLAQRDMVTNLPNRSLFHERLRESMARADRAGKEMAVLFLDLDGFRDVNDTLGHSTGDNLLVAVARRLKEQVRQADILARIGGDEFAVILQDLEDGREGVPLAQRLLGALAEPFHLGAHTLTIGASIGITVYPRDSRTAEALLRNADLAMYGAKAECRGTFRFFSEEMDIAVQERVTLARDLRRALEADEFWMAYQPQVDLKTGELIGAEALLRWTHPTRGLVSAGEFVPIAEDTGLMAPIGEWVVAEVCRQSREWREAGLPELRIAVNISGMQFSHQDVPAMVKMGLAKNRLPPHAIEVEITESVIMGHSADVVDALDALRDAGVSLSLDDFGTGYSSLKYLRQFPVSRLKIDQSFVQGIDRHESDEAIVCAVIALGHNLNLNVIAEGVEEIEQASFLWKHDCDEAQGYFFAKPLSAKDFVMFLKGHRPHVELGRGRSSGTGPGVPAWTAARGGASRGQAPERSFSEVAPAVPDRDKGGNHAPGG